MVKVNSKFYLTTEKTELYTEGPEIIITDVQLCVFFVFSLCPLWLKVIIHTL
jgi:hypothetical protein